jgi:hypothetical protein
MELTIKQYSTLNDLLNTVHPNANFEGPVAEFMNFVANKYKGKIPTKVIMEIDSGNGLAINLDEVIDFFNTKQIIDGTAN